MMNDRLSFAQIALLVTYAAGMVGGQILFKLAALKVPVEGSLGERLSSLMLNWNFIAAVVLYGALSVLWVWILTFTPLSRAYVFVALAFAITPFLGGWLFAEPITARLALGVVLICCGLLFVTG